MKEYLTSWTQESRSFLQRGRLLAIVDPVVEDAYKISSTLNSMDTARGITSFMNFSPNPTWESLTAAMDVALKERVEGVIAIGGGTAIDLAKLTAAALQMGGAESLWNEGKQGAEISVAPTKIPLLAMPTTAGTGAEATRFAVLYRDGIKHSIVGSALKPEFVALDPTLLSSLPTTVIADTGLDAACQAMESLWSVKATPESETEAWAALDLAVEHLSTAVSTRDQASLAAMLVSAHRAGKAIDITTTTAPHALSYGLTSLFRIPHGRAVGLVFGPAFQRMAAGIRAKCAHPNGPNFVITRLESIAARWGQTLDGFPEWWERFLREQLAVKPSPPTLAHLDKLSTTVNAKRLANSPYPFAPAEIREIYSNLSPVGTTDQ
ncbi:iron-containing alcohol dehydrogenase [bacterium]|jgi:alcohol dehydrogenase|nr:iron-containing alcohol dehydrogenase [Verrucomicrobiota bacterium]MDA7645451.1 iron-containing alcohol dehydrogenase [bacterium]